MSKKALLTSIVYVLIVAFCAIGLVACGEVGNNPEKTYTVTFVAEDGKTVVGTDTYTINDKNITEPPVPEKEGYIGTWESYQLTTGNITVRPVYIVDNLLWELSSDGNSYIVTGVDDSNPTNVIIPSFYKGKPVTSIGDSAFGFCSGLASITIPNSVTSIGDSAFGFCSGLASITIPNSVTSIGDYAFFGCSGLTSITIPNSVTSFGENAFFGCSELTSITIPNSVTSIGDYAFSGCSELTSVTIPNSVTSIGDYAFFGCSGLTSITIPNSVTSIGDYVFANCSRLINIYCEAPSKMAGWSNNWKYGCSATVTWGYENK